MGADHGRLLIDEHISVPRRQRNEPSADVIAGHDCRVDIASRVTTLVSAHPDVQRVVLVGSRADGEPTALSDWDFRIHTTKPSEVARDLPELVAPLQPMAAQWDRLGEHATYMLMLPGPIKIDLFPGDERRELQPPWEPSRANLAAVDAHFWDWILWLGGKSLAGNAEIVADELAQMRRHLLGPLGVTSVPATVRDAVDEYRRARDRLEERWGIAVPRRLGDDVAAALRRQGLV